MTTVYLHIGTSKTGTTALQSLFYSNKPLLERYGFCYPDIKGPNHRPQHINASWLCERAKKGTKEERAERDKKVKETAYRTLKDAARQYENIILSDETLWYNEKRSEKIWPEFLEQLGQIGCTLKIIVYFRRQDLLAESVWNQQTKMGRMNGLSFDEYLTQMRYPYHYYDILEGIAKYVGKENIIVRVFEKGQFSGAEHSLYSDFCEQIGLPYSEEYDKSNIVSNPGLTGNFIWIRQQMNIHPQYKEMPDFLKQPLLNANAATPSEKVTAFSSLEAQEAFLAQFTEENAKLARDYMHREDGILFKEPVAKLPSWQLDTETLPRDLIAVFLGAYAQQQKEIEELRQFQKEMKRQQKEPDSTKQNVFVKAYHKITGQ